MSVRVFACHCLNIQVSGREGKVKLQDVKDLDLPEEVMSDPFFSGKAYDVILDLVGITMAKKLLCKTRIAGGKWTVNTCTSCMLDVFAQHPDIDDRVLVSPDTEKGAEKISSLMASDRYSKLFRMILPEINDNFIQNNIDIELYNGNLDQSIENVQREVSNYLRDEQKAMEERIRRFTEEQQSRYAELLQRVRKHKQAMIYLLLRAKEQQPSEDIAVVESPLASPASAVNKDSANESCTSIDSAFDRSETSELSLDGNSKERNVRSLRRTVSNPARPRAKVKREPKRAPLSIDVGGVFDMEEFDVKESLSGQSDDDSDEWENNASDYVDGGKPKEPLMCATSLPMSIPAFSNYSHFSVIDDEDDKMSPIKDPEQIAASMRAIACSVTDGTEMFGELPRRRLNTGELLSSRPI
ncbi:hypothetical protein X975_21314, partial [Stegodyphus mimosarum]